MSNSKYEQDSNLEALADIATDHEKMLAVARIYDPDPEERYLHTSGHLDKRGDIQWHEETAKQVHLDGTAYGLQLWLQRQNYPLPHWDAPAITALGQQMFDLFYREHLQTAAHWTAQAWTGFIQWTFPRQSEQQHRELIQALTALFNLLADSQVLSVTRRDQLIDVLETTQPAEDPFAAEISMEHRNEHVSNKRRLKRLKRRRKR